jgi:acyl-coenzyme A synthetase/AMP-(fatty) acid ligase
MIQEIERILVTHADVAEACVVSTAESGQGEPLKAFVVLRENAILSAETLAAFCRAQLPNGESMVDIRILPELPKSPMGRVSRRKLMEIARKQG